MPILYIVAFIEHLMITAALGVNLGGWLVLEPWITPGLFESINAVDEYTFCTEAGAEHKKHLKQFRDTFITESDFAWLAEQGVKAVRLPIGYWLYGDVKPYMGTKAYVDRAFAWARKHDIKILLSVHGVMGSQNGEMHSGRSGLIGWHTDPNNITKTLQFLERLAKDYGQHGSLLGISVLNEPSPQISKQVLKQYYQQAYALLRRVCHKQAWIVCSDAFRPRWWRNEFPREQYPNLYFDYHHYQIFRWDDKLLPGRLQMWRARHTVPRKVRRMTRRHPIIVGEWSVAMRGGLKYDAKDYFTAQQQAFRAAEMSFYWNYRTGYGSTWSFKAIRTIA